MVKLQAVVKLQVMLIRKDKVGSLKELKNIL